MIPLIMAAISLAQKKQQQNQAEQQQLANNMNAGSQAPQPNINLQSNFGNNAGSLLNPQFETEEERKRRLGF
jgi:hypothetical protein